MEAFLQAAVLAPVAVILVLMLQKNREMGILLSLGVCTMISVAAAGLLRPVLELLSEIRQMGALDRGFLGILLKCAGIGFLSELAGLICTDAGESALAKAIQLLANAAVLLLSLPLLRQLMELLEEVLGGA